MSGGALRTGCLAALALVAACGTDHPADDAEDTLATRAAAIHDSVLTIDSHDDIPFDFATSEVDPLDADRQVSLRKMREGGLDAAFFVVFVAQGERTEGGYRAAREGARAKLDAIHRMTDEMYPDQIGLARSPDDVERIHAAGRLVAVIGVENGYVIGRDLERLTRYYEAGARYLTLTHNGHNDLADSATPLRELGDGEEEHGGLSDFGARVVAEMNRLGMMVDVSHASKQATLDVFRVSRAPVVASHSSVRALADHRRNLDDETLLALRDNGGVVQIVAVGSFVKVQPPERAEELRDLQEAVGYVDGGEGMSHEQRIEYARGLEDLDMHFPPADVSDLVDHIDYAVDLIGIDHVGISSDFDGGGGVHHWSDASETGAVTEELVRRGYTEQEIAKLWGGNLLRVWREVERVAAGSQ